ncbi:thiol reductant ABC exporter subunit CydC [Amycolatopsis sp. NPDC059021]|uniref:thiol reductant ABC exporter subunit CydC n=1 Tax=Amycolatopsis sp. NPDC059021 TaxID=3346704 RepID=UPI00366C3675
MSAKDKLRLARAGLVAAGAELAGLGLMATAAWLLLRAAERPPLEALTVAIVTVRVLALARGGLRYAERLTGHDVVLRYLADVRARVYRALLPHRSARFSGGDMVTRLVSDVDALQDGLLRCVLPASVAAFAGLTTTVVVATASIGAALALAFGLAVAGILVPWLTIRVTARAAESTAPARAELAERAVEMVTGRRELIASGAYRSTVDTAHGVIGALAGRDRSTSVRLGLLTAFGVLVQLLTTSAVFVLCDGVSLPLTAALTLGTLATFEVVLPLIDAARRWPEVRASSARVQAVLTEPAPRPGTRSPGAGHFRLSGAGVRYPGRAPAVAGIDLDLPPGKRVGILGPSGSGKTTLLRLLLGAVEPTSGQVTLDGHELAEYDPVRLPSVVSGALADAHVFHATVRENLLLARPGASDDELRAACAVAGFDLDLDRSAGADGDALSGGQRQRLVLARAVLAAPPVFVLDEPVEGLDTAHGDEVLSRVLATAPGTVVLVTHRPEHVAGFDEVLHLDSGQVVRRSVKASFTALSAGKEAFTDQHEVSGGSGRPASVGGR